MSSLEPIEKEAARVAEDSLYSAKAHFEAGRRWGKIHLAMGLPIALLAGIAGVSALSGMPRTAAVVAFVVAGLTGVMTFLNPERRAASHDTAGTQYLSLRNSLRFFKSIDLPRMNDQAAVDGLKELANHRDGLNESSPPIPRWAFQAARKGIESGEGDHAVDDRGVGDALRDT